MKLRKDPSCSCPSPFLCSLFPIPENTSPPPRLLYRFSSSWPPPPLSPYHLSLIPFRRCLPLLHPLFLRTLHRHPDFFIDSPPLGLYLLSLHHLSLIPFRRCLPLFHPLFLRILHRHIGFFIDSPLGLHLLSPHHLSLIPFRWCLPLLHPLFLRTLNRHPGFFIDSPSLGLHLLSLSTIFLLFPFVGVCCSPSPFLRILHHHPGFFIDSPSLGLHLLSPHHLSLIPFHWCLLLLRSSPLLCHSFFPLFQNQGVQGIAEFPRPSLNGLFLEPLPLL